jgi:hypothetical protein
MQICKNSISRIFHKTHIPAFPLESIRGFLRSALIGTNLLRIFWCHQPTSVGKMTTGHVTQKWGKVLHFRTTVYKGQNFFFLLKMWDLWASKDTEDDAGFKI